MTLSALENELASGSPLAAEYAKILGEPALPAARAALASPSAGTRMAAIYCLEAIGTAGDLPAVAAFVADPSAEVASAAIGAVRAMHLNAPGQGSVVLKAFDSATDPGARVELALALGERADVPLETLRARLKDETKVPVKKALIAALARRGSEKDVKLVADDLGRTKGDDKRIAIERSVYVRSSALLPALVKLLGDKQIVLEVSEVRSPDAPYQRACDLAAWAIGTLLNATFSFYDEREYFGLTDTDLDEVRAAAKAALGEKR